MAFPMVGPSPVKTVKTLLNPFAFNTSDIILPRATVTRDAESAPFQIT